MEQGLPALVMPDIREWTGDRSFALGWEYFERRALSHLRRQGMTLKGRCQGTMPYPYRVEVTLGPRGIVSGACSCPVGTGGRCKHAAALLIAWLEMTEDFAHVEDLDTLLGRLSQAELIALIRRLMKRAPDLEDAIELELTAAAEVTSGTPLDADALRRQIKSALGGGGGGGRYRSRYDYDQGWGAEDDIGPSLEAFIERGHEYLERGEIRNAALVFAAAAEGALDAYQIEYDDEGEIAAGVAGVVRECSEGLAACLNATQDVALRETILRALVDIYRKDLEGEAVAEGDVAADVILAKATPEERHLVAESVRTALPKGGEWSATFRRKKYGTLLLELEADTLDDESYLRLCRETDQRELLIERLLALGRVDEAAGEVATVEQPGTFLSLVDLLRERGHGAVAENVVRKRARTSQDPSLANWLKERAKESGDLDEALALAETIFWRTPSVSGYQEVRALARQVGTWEKVRDGIIAHLTKDGRYALLTELHLLEGQVDEALAALMRVKGPAAGDYYYAYGAFDLAVRVARAAEETRPAEANALYLAEVGKLIAAQGRERYATAAGYLVRVRALYARTGDEAAWQRLIAELRERNKRLRALQDELNKAGL
ncbi:MAG TPA: SWIM zinc finger family protein [Ktedonobacterales bacterium]|nr:SWIM zinc finger family protein [Ktedonobacterales bacterium]